MFVFFFGAIFEKCFGFNCDVTATRVRNWIIIQWDDFCPFSKLKLLTVVIVGCRYLISWILTGLSTHTVIYVWKSGKSYEKRKIVTDAPLELDWVSRHALAIIVVVEPIVLIFDNCDWIYLIFTLDDQIRVWRLQQSFSNFCFHFRKIIVAIRSLKGALSTLSSSNTNNWIKCYPDQKLLTFLHSDSAKVLYKISK